jgi:hypothetical protein
MKDLAVPVVLTPARAEPELASRLRQLAERVQTLARQDCDAVVEAAHCASVGLVPTDAREVEAGWAQRRPRTSCVSEAAAAN